MEWLIECTYSGADPGFCEGLRHELCCLFLASERKGVWSTPHRPPPLAQPQIFPLLASAFKNVWLDVLLNYGAEVLMCVVFTIGKIQKDWRHTGKLVRWLSWLNSSILYYTLFRRLTRNLMCQHYNMCRTGKTLLNSNLKINSHTLLAIQEMKYLTSNWVGQLFWQGASAHFRHLQ